MAKMKIKKLGKGAVKITRGAEKTPLSLESINIGIPFFSVRLKTDLFNQDELLAEIDETASLEDLTKALSQIDREIHLQRVKRQKNDQEITKTRQKLNELIQQLFSVNLSDANKKSLMKQKKQTNEKLRDLVEEKNDLESILDSLRVINKRLAKRIDKISKRRGKALAKAAGDR